MGTGYRTRKRHPVRVLIDPADKRPVHIYCPAYCPPAGRPA